MRESEFAWHGHDRDARVLSGKMRATNKQEVIDHLRAQRIRPTRIHRQFKLSRLLRLNRRIRSSDITRFTRQLATLLQSGVHLLYALDIVARGARHPALKALVKDLHQQVEGGMALHAALRRHLVFDNFYCHLIAAGELAGMLDTMLLRLANHREKTENLHRTLRSALVYPTAVLVIALAVMIFLLSFVVPAFENIFSSFNAQLPAMTRAVITWSHAWQQMGWSFFLVTAGVIYTLYQWGKRQARFKWFAHTVLLHLPVIRRLVRHACSARWSRTLATLFAAGIPLTEALEATQGVTNHMHYQAATQAIKNNLMRGQSLAQALTQHQHLFSPMLVQMCAIGEESGLLDSMLDKAATHYENSVEATVTQLSTLVEPLIMVTLGLLIGGMVVALYLPIFQLGQVV